MFDRTNVNIERLTEILPGMPDRWHFGNGSVNIWVLIQV